MSGRIQNVQLDGQKISRTAARLTQRFHEHFPESSLAKVGQTVSQTCGETPKNRERVAGLVVWIPSMCTQDGYGKEALQPDNSRQGEARQSL
jgi:hypothetical protein